MILNYYSTIKYLKYYIVIKKAYKLTYSRIVHKINIMNNKNFKSYLLFINNNLCSLFYIYGKYIFSIFYIKNYY